MIAFKNIRICNYKSIIDTSLEYTSGVWLVVGKNNDAVFDSNGAGKSSVLEAIQQCLYNKNTKSTSIEDTYNRVTGIGYTIILEFTDGKSLYKVINNRVIGNIYVYKDSVDISKKGITENLKLIQSIIGFDFNSFCALTYISQSTILELLESFSSSNLMKILLDFDTIAQFDSKLKEAMTNNKSTVQYLLQENAQLEDTQKLLLQFSYTDCTPFYKRKEEINDKFMQDTAMINIDGINRKINSLMSDIILIDKQIEEIENCDTVCKTCGQTIYNKLGQSISNLNLGILKKNKADTEKELSDLVAKGDEAMDKLILARAEFDSATELINTTISVNEYKNKLYTQNKDKAEDIRKKIEDNKLRLSNEYFNQDLYDTLQKVLKNGKLHKELIDNFTTVLNNCIDEYRKFMNIDYLNIKAKSSKTSIEFLLLDSRVNQFIELNTLSGGELTRVRIIVLLAMLKAVSTMTTLSTNILVLDEALDTLDSSAAQELSALFQHLIDTEDKFIALVSHGTQLKDIDFKGTLMISKTNNNTTVQQLDGVIC